MARTPLQSTFFKDESFTRFNRREHGGEIAKGKRKDFRPIDPKKPLHLVLRSTRARGEWSMLRARHERRVRHLIYRCASQMRVRIYRFANSGNHLHLVVYSKDRTNIARFLKSASGLIARAVTGAKKGNPVGKFWDRLVYSRIVEWGRDFLNLKSYLDLNELEGLGWREFSPRKQLAKKQDPPSQR